MDHPGAYHTMYVEVQTTNPVQGMESAIVLFSPSRSHQPRQLPKLSGVNLPMRLPHVYVALSQVITRFIIVGDNDFFAG